MCAHFNPPNYRPDESLLNNSYFYMLFVTLVTHSQPHRTKHATSHHRQSRKPSTVRCLQLNSIPLPACVLLSLKLQQLQQQRRLPRQHTHTHKILCDSIIETIWRVWSLNAHAVTLLILVVCIRNRKPIEECAPSCRSWIHTERFTFFSISLPMMSSFSCHRSSL